MLAPIKPDGKAAGGMPHQNVGRRHPGIDQKSVQVFDEVQTGARCLAYFLLSSMRAAPGVSNAGGAVEMPGSFPVIVRVPPSIR